MRYTVIGAALAAAALATVAHAGALGAQEPVTSWRASGGPVTLRLETIAPGGQIHEVDAAGRSLRVLVAPPFAFTPVVIGSYAPGTLLRFGSLAFGVWELQGAPVANQQTWPAGGYRIDYSVEHAGGRNATIFQLVGVDGYADPATGADAGLNVYDPSVVPEPSALALVGAGLLAAGGAGLRRRARTRRAPARRAPA